MLVKRGDLGSSGLTQVDHLYNEARKHFPECTEITAQELWNKMQKGDQNLIIVDVREIEGIFVSQQIYIH